MRNKPDTTRLPCLIVLNYSMDSSNPIFAHQVSTIQGIAPYFNSVTVITRENSRSTLNENISVSLVNWVEGHLFRNILSFYRISLPVIFQNRGAILFSHMTETQSLLIAPFAKALRIRHFLWYAHKSNPLRLRACSRFVDGVITSTKGSSPLLHCDQFAIGQAISPEQFPFREHGSRFERLLHIGRISPSKGIDKILDLVLEISSSSNVSLNLVGSLPDAIAVNYWSQIQSRYQTLFASGRVKYLGAIDRSDLRDCIANHDVFVHAFEGSLDKAILEATISGLPVITLNREYVEIFGRWNKTSFHLDFRSEFTALQRLNDSEITSELVRRSALVRENHSLNSWISKLTCILQGKGQDFKYTSRVVRKVKV
jgi:glycosyltransferase involved in cell wall biosynthesis